MSMRAKRQLTSDMNVVPYIDVMLVLLVIFMITAPLLTTGVMVDLPDAEAEPMEVSEDVQPLVLTVKANGQLYLNVADDPNTALQPDAVTRITAAALQQEPNKPVAVKGDGNGDYAGVVQAMVLLQKAGAEKVGLLTDNIRSSDDTGEDETD